MKTRRKTRRVTLYLIIANVIVLAGILYLLGRWHYSHVYPPRYIVNGCEVHNKTVEELNAHLRKITAERTISIVLRGGETQTLTFQELGVTDKADSKRESWNANRWLMYSLFDTVIERKSELQINTQKLSDCLRSQRWVYLPHTHPANAHFVRYPDGRYELIPALEGEQINPDKLIKAVTHALTHSESIVNLEAWNCYEQPEIRETAQMQQWVDEANSFIKTRTIIKLDNGASVELPQSVLIEATSVDYDGFHIDYNVIKAYTDAIMESGK